MRQEGDVLEGSVGTVAEDASVVLEPSHMSALGYGPFIRSTMAEVAASGSARARGREAPWDGVGADDRAWEGRDARGSDAMVRVEGGRSRRGRGRGAPGAEAEAGGRRPCRKRLRRRRR